jgi:hypothetical protein
LQHDMTYVLEGLQWCGSYEGSLPLNLQWPPPVE